MNDPIIKTRHVRHQTVIEGKYLEVIIVWTDAYTDTDGTHVAPKCEIRDFRAPGHPEVNWTWIDKRQGKIFQSLPLSDS